MYRIYIEFLLSNIFPISLYFFYDILTGEAQPVGHRCSLACMISAG